MSSIKTPEKLFAYLNDNSYRHCRAELVSGGRLFDTECVLRPVWCYVQ
ncbi:hypothetical protein [Kosakonia oryziphila]|nr:hypothetical protein [Kosakonia oryziphila]